MRCAALALLALLVGVADAAPNQKEPRAARGGEKKKKKQRGFTGHNAPKSSFRKTPLEKPSGKLWVYAENLREEARVDIYKADGSFDDAALAQLDELFRCVATGEVRAMRAELYEHLSRIQDHFDGAQLVLVSAFRFGSERSSSRHFHASAVDFRVKGKTIYQIREFAETLDTGNMGLGIYPTSQFVHLDYRAPGAPSFRWVDYSGRSKKSKSKSPRTKPVRKPTS